MKNGVAEGVASEVNATSEIISTHLEQRCYSLPVVTILETFFFSCLACSHLLSPAWRENLYKKKKEKHTHMTREHMEKGEKKVDKTEDKRVVHSFTFSLSFSYNRFFLSITVYIKTVRHSHCYFTRLNPKRISALSSFAFQHC